MAEEDPHYSFKYTGKIYDGVSETTGIKWKGYLIKMTSLAWLTEEDTNKPLWKHKLVVIVPENLNKDKSYINKALISITLGTNRDRPFKGDMNEAGKVATDAGIIGGVLYQEPNAPILFFNDPKQKHRVEDEINAYTSMQYF